MEQILWQPFTAESRQKQIAGPVTFITTFRKGTKWLRPELIGQTVELVDQKDNRTFAAARVTAVKACRFGDIDQIDHDRQSGDMLPSARLEIMKRVYGEYDKDTLTTVVTLGDVVSL